MRHAPKFLVLISMAGCGSMSGYAGPGGLDPDGGANPPIGHDCPSVCARLAQCPGAGGDPNTAVCQGKCSAWSDSCYACLAAASCAQVKGCGSMCATPRSDGGKPAGLDGGVPGACATLHWDDGAVGDSSKQVHTGQPCLFPKECLSGLCLSAGNSSWCANKGDCRDPEDEQCPLDFTCIAMPGKVGKCMPNAVNLCR